MTVANVLATLHGGLSLARFAEVSALLRHAGALPAHEVLAAQGLAESDWKAAQTAWNQAIEDDLRGGGDELVLAFAEALAQAKERFLRDPPDFSSAPPAPSELAEPVALAPAAPPVPQTPSFLRPLMNASAVAASAIPAAAPAPLPVAPVLATAPAPVPAPAAPVPFSAQVPVTVGSAVTPAPAALTGTANLPLQGILSKILPFDSSAQSSIAAASPAPKASPAVMAPSGASPSALDAARAKAHPLEGTAEVEVAEARKSLPFVRVDGAPAGPVAAPAQATVPRLTLEQYASLHAERAEHPERDGQIRARYFVAQDAAWAALQSEWERRMDEAPALRLRLQDLINHYRRWLQRTGG